MKFFVSIVVVLALTVGLAKGCTQGSRKKRYVPTAPEVDDELAEFFEDCLQGPAVGIFQSLRSVVDSVIRDSVWYKEVDDDICSGRRDVAECWIYTLPFLLDTDSSLYQPTAQCICDWAGTCWDPPGHVQKRSTIYSYGPQSSPSRSPRQKPLSASLQRFSRCIDKNAKTFVKKYPSLKKISGRSTSVFLRDHYTFCRTIPNFPYEQRNLFELLYVDRVCPKRGPKSTWRRDTIGVYKEYARRDGPLARIVSDCLKPGWGPWSEWGKCSVSCGTGTETRTRECTSSGCDGESKETRSCEKRPCPDPCIPNPCKNRGRCKRTDKTSYRCICTHGYNGKHCDDDAYIYRAGGYGESNGDCEDEASYCHIFTETCPTGIENICRKSCGNC